jgi:hypothetical protein
MEGNREGRPGGDFVTIFVELLLFDNDFDAENEKATLGTSDSVTVAGADPLIETTGNSRLNETEGVSETLSDTVALGLSESTASEDDKDDVRDLLGVFVTLRVTEMDFVNDREKERDLVTLLVPERDPLDDTLASEDPDPPEENSDACCKGTLVSRAEGVEENDSVTLHETDKCSMARLLPSSTGNGSLVELFEVNLTRLLEYSRAGEAVTPNAAE